MSRRFQASAAAILALPLALLAQSAQQTQPPQPPPTFRTGASLVRVDVTVTNHHGEPVTTLAADDFDVSEDGVPQTVETFKLVSADGRPAEGDDTSLGIRSPEHAAAEAARDDVRVILIFWDEYHIDKFVPAIQGRKALTDFVTNAFGPTDLVALMNPLLPTDAIRWTRNRTDLAQEIKRLEGRYRVYMPTRSLLEEAQLQRREVERLRSEVTISALQSAAAYLGGLKEGRKAIVFVSEGLPALDNDGVMLLQDLVRTANDNNTAIYTMDPRGLGPGSADVLWMLAENTGASAFVNTNTPARALRQVITDASAFYLLGYASTKNPADGKFHQIKVRVKRSGLDVRARRGYWAPGAYDLDRAAKEAAAEVPPGIASALATLTTRPERALELWTGAEPDTDGMSKVTVAWTLRKRPNAPAPRGGRVFVAAHGAAGDESFEAPLDARRLSFPAAPGDLHLAITVRDEDRDIVDEESRDLVIGDPARAAIGLGAPVVFMARTAADMRALGADALPFPGRDFSHTDRVRVRFVVYGVSAADATVSARLLGRAGGALRTLALTQPQPGANVYEVEVPLTSMARGEFLVAIEASAGDDRAEAVVPLRIVS